MPTSKEFRALKRRVAKLRRHFLPSKFSPTGTYSERQLDHVLGFRLLVHAEIEAFLEHVAFEKAKEKVKSWKKDRKASDLILCFLACYHRDWDSGEEAKPVDATKLKGAVSDLIDIAMKQFAHTVTSNHGIREENLRRIFIPIGIRFEELDKTWLSSIDSYGGKRGEAAHTSIGAQKALDPKSEWDSVKELLIGLETLDRLVQKLK